MNSETKQTRCIETYPASDGLDRCRLGVIHQGLHRDESGRSWGTEMVTTISQEQPQPHGTGAPVGERLIELIRERTKLGIEKYGEPLTTHNGRDAKLDALQESIDLNQYLMQALMESEEMQHDDRDELSCLLADYGYLEEEISIYKAAINCIKDFVMREADSTNKR